MNNFWAIIPARYGSTRFIGKPLAEIEGLPMIIHVLNNVSKSKIKNIYVATDDNRIYDVVNNYGYKAIITDVNHRNGTERVNEAASIINIPDNDFIINIQGDEPSISPNLIDELIDFINDKNINLATAATYFDNFNELFSPNNIKITTDINGKALYFSRSIIPYNRNVDCKEWLDAYPYKKHIGIYVYKKFILNELNKLHPTLLEETEKLEQLRWLDNGYSIYVMDTDYRSISVDTPEDLETIKKFIV